MRGAEKAMERIRKRRRRKDMLKSVTTRITKRWLWVSVIGLVLIVAACGGPSPTTSTSTPTAVPTTAPIATSTTAPTSGGNNVSIASFAFSPQSLTVTAGTKVTWTNKDSTTHTVTADGGAFNHMLSPGDTFSFTFTKAGTYQYHCSIHPTMTATIVVQ